MAVVDLSYVRGLVSAAPLAVLARGAARKLVHRVSGLLRRAPTIKNAAMAGLVRPGLFTKSPAARLLAAYRRVDRQAIDRARAEADAAATGHCTVFDRTVDLAAGGCLSFDRDVLSGGRWRVGPPPLLVDPKGVWEPAKLGHLPLLAVAARLFPEESERWLIPLTEQLAAFEGAAIVAEGALCRSPLEMSLRMINLVSTWDLAGPDARWPSGAEPILTRLLVHHASLVAGHLEDDGLIIGTHTLGNLGGLLFAAAALPSLGPLLSQALGDFRSHLERQVGEDGLDFEGSTSYHRFALELLLVALLASRTTSGRFDPVLAWQLRRMLLAQRDFLLGPGLDPAVGDNDDARVLGIVPRIGPDCRHLLSLGATLFGDADLKQPGARPCEEAIFACGPESIERFEALPCLGASQARSFPAGGIHVLRAGGTDLLFRAGPHGQRGVGGHSHNDQLTFVLHRKDLGPVVVDPGTFTYCGEQAQRDRFRSAGVHSSLTLDGREPSLIPDRPFALPDRTATRLVEYDGARHVVEAEHGGFTSSAGGIVHRRRVALAADGGSLLVTDHVTGTGRHRTVRSLPLAPGLSPQAPIYPARRADASSRSSQWVIGVVTASWTDGAEVTIQVLGRASSDVEITLEPTWTSPAYGSRQPSSLVRIVDEVELPTVLWMVVRLP